MWCFNILPLIWFVKKRNQKNQYVGINIIAPYYMLIIPHGFQYFYYLIKYETNMFTFVKSAKK